MKIFNNKNILNIKILLNQIWFYQNLFPYKNWRLTLLDKNLPLNMQNQYKANVKIDKCFLTKLPWYDNQTPHSLSLDFIKNYKLGFDHFLWKTKGYKTLHNAQQLINYSDVRCFNNTSFHNLGVIPLSTFGFKAKAASFYWMAAFKTSFPFVFKHSYLSEVTLDLDWLDDAAFIPVENIVNPEGELKLPFFEDDEPLSQNGLITFWQKQPSTLFISTKQNVNVINPYNPLNSLVVLYAAS